MKKLALLIFLALTAISCTQEPYSERHRFENQFFLVDRDSINNLKVLYPNDEDKVYLADGKLNRSAFEPVENDGLIWFEGDTIFVRGGYDNFYYDGDQTYEQNWIKEEHYSYLKMTLPLTGEHLLSASVLNWN
tara:strand:+ start:15448 stop:15846 length:399 start_codon:yes stop_codon:yes gene_type:complete